MIPFPLTFAAVWLAAASPEAVVLTPENMREHHFVIDCRILETRELGEGAHKSVYAQVLVRFDTLQSWNISEFEAGRGALTAVALRDSDTNEIVMSIPVEILPWDGEERGVAAEFSIQHEKLDSVELVMQKTGVGSFRVDVGSFLTIAQLPEPIVLTPDTMAEHNFFIHIEAWESREYDLERRGAAPTSVRVRFDDMQGPAIESYAGNVFAPNSAYLIVRDGEDVLVNVPVHVLPWEGNDGGLAMEFSIRNELLDDAELRLYEGGVGLFTVDIGSFIPGAME